MDDLLVRMLTELNHVTYLPIAAGTVVFFTQLTKMLYQRFRPAAVANIDFGVVTMLWQLIFWLLFLVADQRGQTLRFENLAQLIETLGPVILGLFGSSVLGQAFYKRAKAQGTPGTRLSSRDIVAKPATEAPPE